MSKPMNTMDKSCIDAKVKTRQDLGWDSMLPMKRQSLKHTKIAA